MAEYTEVTYRELRRMRVDRQDRYGAERRVRRAASPVGCRAAHEDDTLLMSAQDAEA